jgi:tetratricopeptide (TPR) repeat protein
MEAARDVYRRQTEVARALGDERAEAEGLYNESMSYALQSDSASARRLSLEALEKFRTLGDRHGEGRAQWAYLNALAYDQDLAEAEPLAAETVAIFRDVNDRFMLAWALYTQSLLFVQQRRLDAAREALTEALQIFQETHDLSGYAPVLDGFASLEWLSGDRDLAMRIAGAAAAIQDVSGVGLAQRNREYAQFFPADLLAEAPLAEAYAEGQKLTPDEAVRLALGR